MDTEWLSEDERSVWELANDPKTTSFHPSLVRTICDRLAAERRKVAELDRVLHIERQRITVLQDELAKLQSQLAGERAIADELANLRLLGDCIKPKTGG
jgi:hypothetical protein